MTTDEVRQILLLIAADIGVIAAVAFLAGLIAPRVPAAWLRRDALPLTRWDTLARYRAMGIPRLARRLPELGGALGGRSKATLPGTSDDALAGYLVEVRRAEWVHLVSALSWLPLAWFNPWWLTLAFAIAVIAINLPFLAILRHNRLRLTRLLGGERP